MKRGQLVFITFQRCTTIGVVLMASANDRSLLIGLGNEALDSYLGAIALFKQENETDYRDIIMCKPAVVTRVEDHADLSEQDRAILAELQKMLEHSLDKSLGLEKLRQLTAEEEAALEDVLTSLHRGEGLSGRVMENQ